MQGRAGSLTFGNGFWRRFPHPRAILSAINTKLSLTAVKRNSFLQLVKDSHVLNPSLMPVYAGLHVYGCNFSSRKNI
jgi:hypothetical protein